MSSDQAAVGEKRASANQRDSLVVVCVTARVLWSIQAPARPDAVYGLVGQKAYSEIGFSLGNLTPFIRAIQLFDGLRGNCLDTTRVIWRSSWGIEF